MSEKGNELLEDIAYSRYLKDGVSEGVRLISVDLKRILSMDNDDDLDRLRIIKLASHQITTLSFDKKSIKAYERYIFSLLGDLFEASRHLDSEKQKILGQILDIWMNFSPSPSEKELNDSGVLALLRDLRGTVLVAALTVLAGTSFNAHKKTDVHIESKIPVGGEEHVVKRKVKYVPVSMDNSFGVKSAEVGAKSLSNFESDFSDVSDERLIDGEAISREKFNDNTREALANGTLNYGDFFIDAEYLFGEKIIKRNYKNAKKVSEDIDKRLADASDVSDDEFLKMVAEIPKSPGSIKNDIRNKRSYLMDLYSNSELVGNCVARSKVAVDKIAQHRPHLLKDLYVQVMRDHVRAVVVRDKKMFSLDTEMDLLEEKKGDFDAAFFYRPDQIVKKFIGDGLGNEDLIAQTKAVLKSVGVSENVIGKYRASKSNVDPYAALFEFGDAGIELNNYNVNEVEGGGYDYNIFVAPAGMTEKELLDAIPSHVNDLELKGGVIPPAVLLKLQEMPRLKDLSFNMANFADTSPLLQLVDDGEVDYVDGGDPNLVYESHSLLKEVLPRLEDVLSLKFKELKNLPRGLYEAAIKMGKLKALIVPDLEKIPSWLYEVPFKRDGDKGMVVLEVGTSNPKEDFSFEKLKPLAESGDLRSVIFDVNVDKGASANKIDLRGLKKAIEFYQEKFGYKGGRFTIQLRIEEMTDDIVKQIGMFGGMKGIDFNIVDRNSSRGDMVFEANEYFDVKFDIFNDQITKLVDLDLRNNDFSIAFPDQLVVSRGPEVFGRQKFTWGLSNFLENVPEIKMYGEYFSVKGATSAGLAMALISDANGPFADLPFDQVNTFMSETTAYANMRLKWIEELLSLFPYKLNAWKSNPLSSNPEKFAATLNSYKGLYDSTKKGGELYGKLIQ